MDGLDADIVGADVAAERRNEVVSRVREHAGRIAYELARLQGGDYGQRSFSTKRGEWTVKYEAGDLEYLRYKGKSGGEVYVISTKQPPGPAELARAMADYDAFVAAYNEHVASLDGMLDSVDTEFPELESTEAVVAERDRIAETIRAVCDTMAGELHRYEGTDYGSYAARVGGSRWELKWEGDRASYLRVGGEGGVYLVSQYGPAGAPEVRRLAPEFGGFVEAYNEHVRGLELDLREIEL
ncbi:hypothetical protein [Natronomonas sp. EA1]|uniref:hypothetical protein n=1 Tax=Natronomonas sp. EA1 TaxID=3421655 RepID=UPI003EB6F919